MPNSSIWKIHLHSNTTLSTSNLQAHFLWWPSFSQHALTVVMQQSRNSVFYNGNTPFQLGLLWQSPHSCQCLTTETSTQNDREYATETLSISYSIYLYIRLIVIL